MGILLWIIFGGLAGWIASMIMGRDSDMGLVANILVGIVGAFIGGLAMALFGFEGITGFNLGSFLVAIGGSVVLLWLVNMVGGRRHRTM